MAFSQTTKDNALAFFIEGIPLADIASRLNIPLKTLYNWKTKNDWKSYLRIGNIEIGRNAELELYKQVKAAIDNESIGDPAVVDKLAKLSKVLERLTPNRQILGSMYRFLEAQTDYVNRAGDLELTKVWQKHLKPISAHLKSVFSAQE
jgi:hypothetical protein